MSSASSSPRSVAVIGGGITGLAAAYHLRELSPNCQVTLFEAGERVGGVVKTERCGDYLVENGADMFTTKEPWALALCKRLGLGDDLINTNSQHSRAFVVHRGRLCPVPDGFTLMMPGKAWPIIKSPLLSLVGKMRMGCEFFIPSKSDTND